LIAEFEAQIIIPARLARMSFLQFLVFTIIGAYILCTLIIGVGYIVGHEWHLISGLVGRFTPWAVAGFVALAGAGWMIRWFIQRRMHLQSVYLKINENE
jgi:membrane protein DedA with SNARE-associated domain